MRLRAIDVTRELRLRRVLADVCCQDSPAIHVATLPLEKISVKRGLFWQKMDNIRGGFKHAGMKKPAVKRPPKAYVPVYLAEWLEVLGVAPVDLVKADVISEGYLSLLRSGKRLNPSPGKLQQIGAFLKIQWTDLYRPPPTREAIEAHEGLSEATIQRLRNRQRSN